MDTRHLVIFFPYVSKLRRLHPCLVRIPPKFSLGFSRVFPEFRPFGELLPFAGPTKVSPFFFQTFTELFFQWSPWFPKQVYPLGDLMYIHFLFGDGPSPPLLANSCWVQMPFFRLTASTVPAIQHSVSVPKMAPFLFYLPPFASKMSNLQLFLTTRKFVLCVFVAFFFFFFESWVGTSPLFPTGFLPLDIFFLCRCPLPHLLAIGCVS